MISNIKPLSKEKVEENKISIMIPFAANGDRGLIFMAAIKHLYNLIKDKNIEICVHESAPTRFLEDSFIEKYCLKYVYTNWTEVFHKAWNLNVIAKYTTTGDYLVVYDGDLIVDAKWIADLQEKASEYYCGYGWTSIKYLTTEATNRFIHTGIMPEYPQIWNTVYPQNEYAAGGINIISRKDFFDLRGWPEDFRGSWGGADNGFAAKTRTMGIQRHQHIHSDHIYHLNHDHKTHKQDTRFIISDKLDRFNKDEWLQHIKAAENWGDINLSPVTTAQRINVIGDMIHEED